MLHERIIRVPAKGLCQVLGRHAGVPKLKLQDSADKSQYR